MIVRRIALLTVMISGAIFGMEKESRQSLIARLADKPQGVWIQEYQKQGLPIEQVLDDYFKENPSWHQLMQRKEHNELMDIIKTSHSMFECMAPKIRDLAQKNKNWKKIVDNADHTNYLLHMINRNLDNYACYKNGFDLSVRNNGLYIYLELGAALLGTPGAIKCGQGYIEQDSTKKRLKDFLFDIVGYGGRNPHSCDNCLSWPDEDRDVVKAGLEMGLDSNMLSDAEGFHLAGMPLLITAAGANKMKVVELLLDKGADKEIRSMYETEFVDDFGWEQGPKYTQSYTALYAASRSGSQDVVDVLIQRGAHVNATDALGRTSLIVAARYGHVEIVEKLLAAEAVVWLLDAYDKCALDYAQERLSKGSGQDKEKYEKIVQLLKDAK